MGSDGEKISSLATKFLFVILNMTPCSELSRYLHGVFTEACQYQVVKLLEGIFLY